MTPEERKEFVRRSYDDVFNKGELDRAPTYFADDFVNRSVPGLPPGPDGVRRSVTILRAAFPDLHYLIEEVLVDGDMIAARWTVTGTHTGMLSMPFGLVAPTGRAIRFPGMTMGRVADGKACGETWIISEMLAVLRELSTPPQQRAA